MRKFCVAVWQSSREAIFSTAVDFISNNLHPLPDLCAFCSIASFREGFLLRTNVIPKSFVEILCHVADGINDPNEGTQVHFRPSSVHKFQLNYLLIEHNVCKNIYYTTN